MVLRIKGAGVAKAPVESPKAPVAPDLGQKPLPSGAPTPGMLAKPLKLGKSEVRTELDPHEEQGKVKFLVHRTKPGIWYRVCGYDEKGQMMKLRTKHDRATFPSALYRNTPQHYVMVVEPEGAIEPSADAMALVQKLLSKASE